MFCWRTSLSGDQCSGNNRQGMTENYYLRRRKRIAYSLYPLPFSLASFPFSFPFHLIGTPLTELKDWSFFLEKGHSA